jgi:hypothetical protein
MRSVNVKGLQEARRSFAEGLRYTAHVQSPAVVLPNLRDDHAAACSLPCDCTRLCRTEPVGPGSKTHRHATISSLAWRQLDN